MPGRARLKRAGTVLLLIATTICVAACASSDHSWRGEFDTRLEGASAAIEETTPKWTPGITTDELLRTSIGLARRLEFKRELIANLDPPEGCEALEEAAVKKVSGLAQHSYDLEKNMTPYLRRRYRADFEGEVAILEELEREAAHCETA
jgi:hypothetical protein